MVVVHDVWVGVVDAEYLVHWGDSEGRGTEVSVRSGADEAFCATTALWPKSADGECSDAHLSEVRLPGGR